MNRPLASRASRASLLAASTLAALALGAVACSSSTSPPTHLASASTSPAATSPPATSPAATSPAATAPAAPSTTTPISSTATTASSSATRHCWPIVLVHGQPGFSTLGPIDYFYDVPHVLSAAGFDVWAPTLAGSSIADRARSLHDQLLARYPDPRVRVNLIAHSAGGLDARCAITLGLGAKVASLTTLGTPHRGCAVNDLALALFPNVPGWLDTVLGVAGLDRSPDFTTTYVNGTFDPQNPDDPAVAYFSWAGQADPGGATTGAAVDPLFLLAWSILDATEGANDGVVSVESAKWGTFEGTLAADHLALVGQPLGLTGGFDHRRFYEDWADELERRGFGP